MENIFLDKVEKLYLKANELKTKAHCLSSTRSARSNDAANELTKISLRIKKLNQAALEVNLASINDAELVIREVVINPIRSVGPDAQDTSYVVARYENNINELLFFFKTNMLSYKKTEFIGKTARQAIEYHWNRMGFLI